MSNPGCRHVALLHYSAPPIVGGVESVMAHQARLIANDGHRVRVLAGRGAAFDGRIPFLPLPLADSRHPRILAAKRELDAGVLPPAFSSLVSELAGILRAALQGVDVLVAHNVGSLHKNLALTAALRELRRRGDAPHLILWHHDLAWTTPRYRHELHEGYPWDLLRTDWGAQHVVVSQLRQQELAGLLGLPADDIRVVPNGIWLEEFYKLEPETRDLVEALQLSAAAPILLLPVRLTPRKNIELALQVLACLRRQHPRATLVVTGPPGAHNPANAAYLARLQQLRADLGLDGAAHLLAERTREPLSDAVIADFYRLADALLLPSREEGFGLPVLEAGLSRLPAFCADIPPLRALGLSDALYFSPDEGPERVAGMIDARLEQDAGYRLAVRVRQHYAWTRVYAMHIAPLILGAPRRPPPDVLTSPGGVM